MNDYKKLLNPKVEDGQVVWSIREVAINSVTSYSCIWDELEELEPNPTFWFESKEDLLTFVKNTPIEEIELLINSETYYK